VLARENDVSVADAAESVGDLVAWWKLANRRHRPLVGSEQENAKAVSMMLDEHRRRLADTRRPLDMALVARLRVQHPRCLLVARKRDGAYVVLDPEDDGDVFVTEHTYSARGQQKSRSEWQLVGSRRTRWTIAYSSPALDGWDTMASRADHFTGPEIEAAIEVVRSNDRVAGAGRLLAVMLADNTHGDRRQRPRLAALTIDDADGLDEEHPLSGSRREPQVHSHVFRLTRDGTGAVVTRLNWDDSYPTGSWPCWEPTSNSWARAWRQVFLDDAVVAEAEERHERYLALRKRVGELGDIVRRHEQRVCEQWNAREERRAYEAFLAKYADPELWEGHKKTITIRTLGFSDLGSLRDALAHLVEAGQILDGLSVAEVCERARVSFGVEERGLPDEVGGFVV
nr:hypothetical protein [Actinomycetota bacterium]